MIDVSPHHLRIIKGILKEYVPTCEVRVFGSRVVGKSKKYSDIDLAIVGESKLPRKVIHLLQEAFAESVLPFRVDVIDWNAISESFKKIIDAKYVII